MQKNNADLCTANLSIDIISLSSFKMHCLTQKEKKNFQNMKVLLYKLNMKLSISLLKYFYKDKYLNVMNLEL